MLKNLKIMASKNLKYVIGRFSDHQDVEQAQDVLTITGFPMHKISIVTHQFNGSKVSSSRDVLPPILRIEGAKMGGILGSIEVGVITLIIGLGALLVPGVGSALALESLLATFLGSGAAATAGGLYGALQGWLAPEKLSEIHNRRFKQGEYLILTEATEEEISVAKSILKHLNIQELQIYDAP